MVNIRYKIHLLVDNVDKIEELSTKILPCIVKFVDNVDNFSIVYPHTYIQNRIYRNVFLDCIYIGLFVKHRVNIQGVCVVLLQQE